VNRVSEVASAFVSLAPSARGFGRQLDRQVGPQVDGVGHRMGRRIGALLAGGGALGFAGIVKGAVGLEASFSQTMNQIAAVTNTPKKQLADLSDLAIKMGADTVFSANDASSAMLELAKGGLTAAQIKAGGLKGTLTLAAAGGLDLASAATFASNAMNTFGLTSDKIPAIAAALAGGANASTASVESLGQALSQVGPGAKNAGLSLQDTVGVLAAFDQAGIKGSDAGTSLKTALARLVPQTDAAKAAMRKYNLEFVNADGSFKDITQVAESLRQGLGKLSDSQKSATLTTIFGSDATRAATVLMDNGAKGIGKYIGATKDLNAAERIAASRMKGTSGAIEAFKGSLETVGLQFGRLIAPAVQAGLRSLTNGLNGIGPAITKIGTKIGPAAQGIHELFTAGAGAPALSAAMRVIRSSATGMRDAFRSAADSLGRIKGEASGIDFSHIDTKSLGKVLSKALFEGIKDLAKFGDKLLDFFKGVDWVGIGIKVGTLALPFVLGLATGIINGVGDPALWKGIWDHLPDILLAALTIVFAPSKLAGPITRILTRIPFVGRFLAVAFKWLNDLGGPLRSFGKDLFETFAKAFKGELPFKGIVGRVLAGFRGLLARVGEFFGLLKVRLGVWALDAFGAMGRFAGQSINRLVRIVTFIPRKILSALGTPAKILFNAGKEVISGLISGITSKLGDLGNAMKGVADKIKGFLPGSPVKEGPLTSWNNGGAGKRLVSLLADGLVQTDPIDTAMTRLTSRISTTSLAFQGGSTATASLASRRMRLVIPGHEFDGYVDDRADSRVGAQRGLDGMKVRAFG